MFINVVRNTNKQPLFQVCTTAAERGENVGGSDVLFKSSSCWDAALVLRYLNGGQLNDSQLEHFDRLCHDDLNAPQV